MTQVNCTVFNTTHCVVNMYALVASPDAVYVILYVLHKPHCTLHNHVHVTARLSSFYKNTWSITIHVQSERAVDVYLKFQWVKTDDVDAFISLTGKVKHDCKMAGCRSLTTRTVFILTFSCSYSRLRPYHVEHTASRPICQVKQRRVRLVLGSETAWEHRML